MLSTTNVEACTGIKLVAKDGSLVHGRTLEFGIKVDCDLVVIPRGYEFKGTTPQGPGLSYKAKYASVGAIAFNKPAVLDGLNEKGLAIGTFYFQDFAGYADITPENQSKALSPIEFSNWILTQFSTIEEVRDALNRVVIAPTVISEWGTTPVPLHYIIYDNEGNSLVIEPIKGKLIAYNNPLGVLTNPPSFDWHMTNLRNYINLTPFNVKPINIKGLEIAPLGQGSGMVGLPGDFTPPSRFVRAAIFSITAIPSTTSETAVFQAFHILNQFDIPVGVARNKENGIIYTDYTQMTAVRDPQALRYYFKTYENQNIQFVDLNKFDFEAHSMKHFSASGNEKAVDISAALK